MESGFTAPRQPAPPLFAGDSVLSAARPTPRRLSTLVGMLALAALPVVPMPIAGGTPISVALIGVLILAQFAGRRPSRLDGVDLVPVGITTLLLLLELVTALMTSATADFQYALARFYWLVLLVVTLFFTNAELARGNSKFIINAISLGLIVLLLAMIAQSLFYPQYDTGRDFGVVQMPLPRATGVPNSDGKIGTFLAICLTVGLFYGKRLPLRQYLLLLIGPFLGLMFTQSRSGLVAFVLILAFHWTYMAFSSRNAFARSLRWIITICALVLAFHYMSEILSNLMGQGTLERNVLSRGRLAYFAFDKIAEAPFFGSGADAVTANGIHLFVHNTSLAMAVKSGVLAALLISLTIVYPALGFSGDMRFTFFKLALVAGLIAEHSLYPGFINEFLVISYVTAKCIWQIYVAPRTVSRPAFSPMDISGGALANQHERLRQAGRQ